MGLPGRPINPRGDPWEGFQGSMGDPVVSMGDSRGDPGTFLGESWAPRGDQGAPGVAYESLWVDLGRAFLEKVLKWPWKAKESHLRPYNAPKRFL